MDAVAKRSKLHPWLLSCLREFHELLDPPCVVDVLKAALKNHSPWFVLLDKLLHQSVFQALTLPWELDYVVVSIVHLELVLGEDVVVFKVFFLLLLYLILI